MKVHKIIILALALCLLGCTAWFLFEKKRTSLDPQVNSGTLEFYHDFHSVHISPRTVTVWLPDGYQTGEECCVLYMHDGQMLFDSTTTWNRQEWKVDEVLGRLMADGTVKRTIVVGIDNTPERLRELLPGKIQSYMDADDIEDPAYALGDSYLKFVTEEVKPFIDSLYRPLTDREHTFIAGSSMGGLISLYALCEYPEVFGGAACLSSHISISYLKDFTDDSDAAADAFLRYVSDMMPDRETTRLYMDYGKAGYDSAYGPYQERMDSLFLSRGWDEDHYRSLAFEGHDHNETCWASRLHEPLQFLLGEK